jgi:hypothetical protein
VFARKISPDTFSLFKGLHVQGAQYYRALAMPRGAAVVAKIGKELRWFPVVALIERDLEAPLVSLNNCLIRVGTRAVPNEVRAAGERAITAGLDESSKATPQLFRDWATDCGIQWPAKALDWWKKQADWYAAGTRSG